MLLSRRLVKVPRWVILIAVVNTALAVLPQVALYRWVKVYEYYWLYRYLLRDGQSAAWSKWLSVAVLWTAALAIGQFVLQHSLGGWLYWLGERRFDITTPGIARVVINSRVWLRPYATLPHPNALAGWMLIAGMLASSTSQLVSWAVIPFTFSRSATLLLPLSIWWRSKLAAALFLLAGLVLFLGTAHPSAVADRVILSQVAVKTIAVSPLWGVGLGNFIPAAAPFIRQPVHNIYLLLAAELGLPVTVVLILELSKKIVYLIKLPNYLLATAVLGVVAIGMVDHYWLTLQQNVLLLVVLGATVTITLHAENSYRWGGQRKSGTSR